MGTQRRTATVLVSQIDGGWFDRESLLLLCLLLSGFHAWILLVNHVDMTFALNNLSAFLVLDGSQ